MAAKTDTIELYRSKTRTTANQYGWRYRTKNSKKVAIAGELYEKETHAEKMATYLFKEKLEAGTAVIKRLRHKP